MTTELQANIFWPTTKVDDRVDFHHASLFSPTLSTLTKYLDSGYLTMFPDIYSIQVRRHPPHSVLMNKGHTDQDLNNLLSTKADDAPVTEITDDEDQFLISDPSGIISHDLYANVTTVTSQKILTWPEFSSNYCHIVTNTCSPYTIITEITSMSILWKNKTTASIIST